MLLDQTRFKFDWIIQTLVREPAARQQCSFQQESDSVWRKAIGWFLQIGVSAFCSPWKQLFKYKWWMGDIVWNWSKGWVRPFLWLFKTWSEIITNISY